MATTRRKRRMMGEINVVPYIDVMLVLLVIFMITAPMLSQGVKVDLPRADAEPIPQQAGEPLVVSIDAAGAYYLSLGSNPQAPLTPQSLLAELDTVLKRQPGQPVYVKGDRNVAYGKVVALMAMLKSAGVESVGLMTDTPEDGDGQ